MTASATAFRCRGVNVKPVQLARASIHPTAQVEIGIVIDVAQRAKRQIGLRAGKVIELPAQRLRQHPDRVAAVESENLCARIAEPLRRDQSERRRFAGAGRPDDQRVAEIGNMQVEAERGRAAGRRVQQAAGCSSASGRSGFSRRPAHTEVIGIMSARFSVCSRTRRTFE